MKVITLLLAFLVTSCVGTVNETKPAFTTVREGEKSQVEFLGVDSVSAISDKRIEVFFYPASGGSGNYSYDIFVGTSTTPLTYSSDVLSLEWTGKYKVTLSGLSQTTTYLIRVEARDASAVNGKRTDSGRVLAATTFSNRVADFRGILGASNVSGQNGKDSIRVTWSPALKSGSFIPQGFDPDYYEIVVIVADGNNALQPSAMDLRSLGPEEGRYVFQVNHDDFVAEHIVRGLPANTEFYVRMRAIHRESVNDIFNPGLRSELNTNVVKIRTLSDDIADINFQEASFRVDLAPGSLGLSSAVATWEPAFGVFDHFRIYYGQAGSGVASNTYLTGANATCLGKTAAPVGTSIFCHKVDFDKASFQLTDLESFASYEVALVLCVNPTCNLWRLAPYRSILINPVTASFQGIQAISSARSFSEIGSFRLTFERPNGLLGHIDGLNVYMRRSEDDTLPETQLETWPSASQEVYYENFNYLLEDAVVVRGIDYSTQAPYCFSLVPYRIENGVTVERRAGMTWRCATPRLNPPSLASFIGAIGAQPSLAALEVDWVAPVDGVFSHYEVFWRKNSLEFNFLEAISQAGNAFDTTNYGRMLVDGASTSVTLTGLASGSYAIGVLTYVEYVGADGIIRVRSEPNLNVIQCTLNNTNLALSSCGQ